MDKTPEQYREIAKRAEANVHRIDAEQIDDGYVSRFCSQLDAHEALMNAELAERGGKGWFPALFYLSGKPVRAKAMDTVYGSRWMVLTTSGKVAEWLPCHGWYMTPRIAANLAKKGYKLGKVLAPAEAKVVGSGTGLSGLSTCHVVVMRNDDGYDLAAKFTPLDDDQGGMR